MKGRFCALAGPPRFSEAGLEEKCDAAHSTDRDREIRYARYRHCVVNYANYADTIKCAQSLLNQKNVSCRIVIVENGSPNDSTERLRRTGKGYQTEQLAWMPRRDVPAGYGHDSI